MVSEAMAEVLLDKVQLLNCDIKKSAQDCSRTETEQGRQQ